MWYLPYPRPQNGWPLGWSFVKDSLLLGSLVDTICHGLLGCSPGRPSLFPAYSKQTSSLTQPSVRGDSSGIKPSFSQLKLLLLMLNRPKQGAFIVCHCIILNHFHVFVQWKDKQKQMLIIRNPTPRAVTRYLSNHSCSLTHTSRKVRVKTNNVISQSSLWNVKTRYLQSKTSFHVPLVHLIRYRRILLYSCVVFCLQCVLWWRNGALAPRSLILLMVQKSQATTVWMVQKPCKYWDILHINWCRISSINSIRATTGGQLYCVF